MYLEELTNERFELMVKLAASGLTVDIEPLEKDEAIGTTRFRNIFGFYVSRNKQTYSVYYTLRTDEEAAQAQDVLEEHGLDGLLRHLWSGFPILPDRKYQPGYRGMTEERWDDLFYFVSHQMVYFVWRGEDRNSLEWSPILICNDLWLLACSDFSEIPVEQFTRLRAAHEQFGWYGQAAWACQFSELEPHDRTRRVELYKSAREWCNAN